MVVRRNTSLIIAVFVLIIGVAFFGYETNGKGSNFDGNGIIVNPTNGGRSFVKFRVNFLPNHLTVSSYLNVLDTDGNIYASRLDPFASNTSVRISKTISQISSE